MVQSEKLKSRGEKTQQKILDAAEEVFACEGFDGARMEDIGGIVGITRAGLFYYYKDKSALYEAMLENVMSKVLLRMREQINPETPLTEQIENCAMVWVDYVWRHPNFARIVMREGAKPVISKREKIAQLAMPILELLEELLEKADQ